MPYDVLDPSLAVAAPTTTWGNPLTSIGETLETIRAELVARLQNRTDITNGTADYTRMDKCINQAYRNLCAMLDLKELQGSVALTTVASKNFYLIPLTVAWITKLSLADSTDYFYRGGTPLEKIDLDEYRILPDTSTYFQNQVPILPCKFFRWNRMVVVWPTPTGVYTLPMDFRVRPAKLTNTTDSPILPEEFHESLIHAAEERLWNVLKMPDRAAIARNNKVDALRSIINTDGEENSQSDSTITSAYPRNGSYLG